MTSLAFPAILLFDSFLFARLTFVEQSFLAVFNPLAFLMYNAHTRFVLLFTVTTLLRLALWLTCLLVADRSIHSLKPLRSKLAAVPLFYSDRSLWLAIIVTLIGVLALIFPDPVSQTIGTPGFVLALGGVALGSLAFIARSAGGFSLSPRM